MASTRCRPVALQGSIRFPLLAALDVSDRQLSERFRVLSARPTVHLAAIAVKAQGGHVEIDHRTLALMGPDSRPFQLDVGGDINDLIEPLQGRPNLIHQDPWRVSRYGS